MAKLRMAHASTHGARKPPGPKDWLCVYCVRGGAQHHVHDGGVGDEPSVQVQPPLGEVDSELHFLIRCDRFKTKRMCFLKRLECYVPNILGMSELDQTKTILCPTTTQAAKLADKFVGLMFKAREAFDTNTPLKDYPTWVPGSPNPFMIEFGRDLDESHNFADVTFVSDDSLSEVEP